MDSRPLLLLLDAPPGWAEPVAAEAEEALGFRPAVERFAAPAAGSEERAWARELAKALPADIEDVLLLPCSLEFGLGAAAQLGDAVEELQRLLPAVSFLHDDGRLHDPLVAEAFEETAAAALRDGFGRGGLGLLAAADGAGDSYARAGVFRLMRLLWERLGAQRGEAAFLEGARPGVNETLERALGEDVDWLVLPLSFGADPLLERLRGLVERIARERPGAGGRIRLARAPEDHPALIRWVAHRVAALWSGKLHEESFRRHSERRAATAPAIRLGRLEAGGVAAEVRDAAQLRSLLPRALLDAPYTFVKVAWSGRVAGGYTDAIALDLLLEALPGRAILLEGHPSGAALGNGDAPAAEAARREWLRERQRRFLEETGLRDVIERRQAQHVNVTEAFWEEACASSIDVGGLDNPDLAACVPAVVAERRGAPLISFARFQGPTKLSLANLFELVPEPLRAGWDVNDPGSVAAVCCDLAKIYGSLLSLYGLVEGFHVAVRWSDEGLHQSEWGSYDLVPQPGLATFSEGLAAADVLAARLEGHDLSRSAFYDVVRTKLGLSSEAERLSLPQEWLTRFRAAPSRAG